MNFNKINEKKPTQSAQHTPTLAPTKFYAVRRMNDTMNERLILFYLGKSCEKSKI